MNFFWIWSYKFYKGVVQYTRCIIVLHPVTDSHTCTGTVNTQCLILNCQTFFCMNMFMMKKMTRNSNMTSFFRFVDKRVIYRWYNLIHTCAGECDWLFYWQHKLCETFSASVDINYRLPIKVYYRICTLRYFRIGINHESQNVFWVLTWVGSG